MNRKKFYAYRQGQSYLLTLALFFTTLSMPVVELNAAPGIRINPTRVVFEGRNRSAEVTLSNSGTSSITYRISFKNMRMTDEGRYEDVDTPDPGQNFAGDMIRYSPRQITLDPGTSQAVRLMARKPRDLKNGEYRSHLLFMSIPDESAGTSIEVEPGTENAVTPTITQRFGIYIPVLVRHGNLESSAGISELSMETLDLKSGPLKRISITLEREGTQSLYGDLQVYLDGSDGSELSVSLARGVAVFTPNKSRKIVLDLTIPEGYSVENPKYRVVYTKPPKEGGDVLAEATLTVE